jgi:glutaredoxin
MAVRRPQGLGPRTSTGWLLALVLGLGASCDDEKPPSPPVVAPSPAATAGQAAAEAFYEPGATTAVLTYAGDRGTFADTSNPEAVPEEARGLVRVRLLEGQAAPPGMVWVANLRAPAADGRYRLQPVARDMFEELALGQGRGSAVELPEGLEPPAAVAAPGGIIVYKTAWCGVCKQLEAYLQKKGVAYEAKDIEQDHRAAAELQAKARAKSVRTGSVPVIDVRGELIVGFDRARLETLL